ncbi:MAG: molybdenum cofactor guanylyltransferase [Methylomicrobium sp.]
MTVTGVILAGGLARRMNGQDKGLVPFCGRPLIEYAIDAAQPLVDRLIINANRHIETYRRFGLPVVADRVGHFDGPLAGMLSAMMDCDSDWLLVVPCDSPRVTTEHLRKLLNAAGEAEVNAAVAFDGERLHPVFSVVKTALEADLQAYLAGGERKVERWLMRHRTVRVDFGDEPEIFANVNTLAELLSLADRIDRQPTS